MSGRVKVRIGDRVVTGYRKTDRRNPRRLRAEGRTFRFTMTFQLPPLLAWSTRAGPVSSFVSVDADGLVTVTSFDRAVTRRKAKAFIKAIVGELDVVVDIGPISATIATACTP